MESLRKSRHFIENIIEGMLDCVRVLDKDENVIYINKSMSDLIDKSMLHKKCFASIGLNEPCENCISKQTVFDGLSHEKEENIGSRTFSVMSSPLKNESGQIIAIIEVFRETTQLKKLQEEVVKKNTKLQDELNMAKRLQYSLLPKKAPNDKVKFSFVYLPCDSLGGDFVDIFKIDQNHIGYYIADVSGHGVPASMLTIFLRSTLDKKQLSPSKALKGLYSEFNTNSLDENMYITIFYAIIDTSNNTMIFSNAGHNVCPIVLRDDTFELLRVPGIPISNWAEEPAYEDGFLELKPGNRICLYTDGIVEMKNPSNEQFGEERLLEHLTNRTLEPKMVLDKLVSTAIDFSGLSDISNIQDDMTVSILEIK